eukprot:TRINITY_DN20214_c0_g2_i1.p1 TRINITY_DN20214_c0_g2~~TRINITY_DN20214_c0_g2_i1.p1  ORF type:complete len:258 (-),score=23.20 TRINITY_DN20214_c0_g2_i1:36-809(-)
MVSQSKKRRLDLLDQQYADNQRQVGQSKAQRIKKSDIPEQDVDVKQINNVLGDKEVIYEPLKSTLNLSNEKRADVIIECLEKIMSKGQRSARDPRQTIQDKLGSKTLTLDNLEQSRQLNKVKKRCERTKLYRNFKQIKLSRKQFKKLETPVSWEVASNIHGIWLKYVQGVVAQNQGDSLLEKLYMVDIVGARVKVLSHKDVRLVGVEGIVVKCSSGKVHIVQQNGTDSVVGIDSCQIRIFLWESQVVDTKLNLMLQK